MPTENFSVLRMRIRAATLCLLLSSVVWSRPSLAATLKAGVARVDITPPAGLRLWGYGNRKGVSTGTLDPLYARVIVLEAREYRLPLLTLDLGRLFAPASLENVQGAAKQSSAISYAFVT